MDWRASSPLGAQKVSHLMNFLGSVGGVCGGRGLLELNSWWWRGELGRGSRRLGWARGGGGGGCGGCGGSPLPEPVMTTPTPMATPTPAASRALTLEELLNLLAAVFSFFFFCYTQTTQTEQKRGREWGEEGWGKKGKLKIKIMMMVTMRRWEEMGGEHLGNGATGKSS